MAYIKLTFFHTLYQKDITVFVDDIVFHDDGIVTFSHMGRKEAIDARHIKKMQAAD